MAASGSLSNDASASAAQAPKRSSHPLASTHGFYPHARSPNWLYLTPIVIGAAVPLCKGLLLLLLLLNSSAPPY